MFQYIEDIVDKIFFPSTVDRRQLKKMESCQKLKCLYCPLVPILKNENLRTLVSAKKYISWLRNRASSILCWQNLAGVIKLFCFKENFFWSSNHYAFSYCFKIFFLESQLQLKLVINQILVIMMKTMIIPSNSEC